MNPEVDTYLEAVPADRRAVVRAIRDACVELLVGFSEVIQYGMPGYVRDGELEVGFANQKDYISLYILRTDVLGRHRDQLSGLSVGKGAIRYRRPDQVDLDLVRSMLRDTAAAKGPVC